jgi:tyrosyl-tRNA synthetase
VRLAKHIAAEFHDGAAADAAEKAFFTATSGGVPDDIGELQVGPGPHGILDLLSQAGFISSNSEGIRSIRQGGVKLDGEKVEDPKQQVTVESPIVLQLGKRKFVRLI